MVNKSRSILKKEWAETISYHQENLSIEYEIECPPWHDVMTLQSESDPFCYFCEECCFTLSLTEWERRIGFNSKSRH
jgi:hypothetical protein